MNASKPSLLLVDDEERILRSLAMLFRGQYLLHTTTDARQALEIVARQQIHVVVSDQKMPVMRGADLLREVKERSPNTMRILLTGYSELDAIIASVNEGEIFRYVNKPWDAAELRTTVDQAAQIAYALYSAAPSEPAPVTAARAATAVEMVPAAPQAAELDAQTLAQWVEAHSYTGLVREFATIMTRAVIGADPDEISALFWAWYVAQGDSIEVLTGGPGGAQDSVIEGGAQQLSLRLAAPLGEAVRLGQPVRLSADLYGGGVTFHGTVAGFSAGTGGAFALLPAQNATGNWIKVVQRLPVRIRLDPKELAEHPLRIGLSMHATIDVHDSGSSSGPAAEPSASRTSIYDQQASAADALVDKIISDNRQ